MIIVLGNRDAVETHFAEREGQTPERIQTKLAKGKRFTIVRLADDLTPAQVVATLTDGQGVWAFHAAAGSKPAWVAAESPDMASFLSSMWGGIEIRSLQDPVLTVDRDGRTVIDPETGKKRTATPNGKIVKAASTALLGLLPTQMLLGLTLFMVLRLELKTNAGNDFQAKQMAGAASASALAVFMGLTANATAPAAGDTTLSAEIATAGGGLIRKSVTYAHTGGANTYTLTGAFTGNASDVYPVTINKFGVFDAVTVGNLVFETAITPATLNQSGDAVTITQTVTM